MRYRDLAHSDLNVDFQIHTVQTDGEATVDQILERASEIGLGRIAFTEHVRRETTWFPQFVQSIRRAASGYPKLDVFVGCETKAMDVEGTLDLTQEILEASDIVLGSVHRFPDGKGGFHEFDSLRPDVLADMEYELALGMVRHAPIDVLAHPGGMYERRHGIFPVRHFRNLMQASLERQVAIEINSSYLRDFDGFLRLCDEINPFVSIGSDAHKLAELGRCRDRLRNAREGVA